jgi:hypothetical protein
LLLLMILPFFYSYFFNKDPTAKEPSIFLIVALAGSLGAFVSALTRLYHFQDLPTALVAEDLKGLHSIYLAIYSFVPPFVGAISAAVLYMVFAGGLFDGALFPHFVCKLDQGCRSFANFISYWGPDDAPDYAKALVLGFVAGFAERFVPDTLSALAKSANETHPK